MCIICRYYLVTKIRHTNCHISGVKTCIFLLTRVYTIFFVVNRHNTRECTFFINKIIHENAALFLVGKYQFNLKMGPAPQG